MQNSSYFEKCKFVQKYFTCNISYNISCSIAAKPLRLRFDKINGFIRVYDETRYLVLFGSKNYDSIYNRIRYIISVKGDVTYVIFYNYSKIKVDSYNSLPLEKTMTFHYVIIVIQSFWNKDKNNYYYSIFLEKASFSLKYKCHTMIELTSLKELI